MTLQRGLQRRSNGHWEDEQKITAYRMCSRRPYWRTETIEWFFFRKFVLFLYKYLLLFDSSNLAAVNTLYTLGNFYLNIYLSSRLRKNPGHRRSWSCWFHRRRIHRFYKDSEDNRQYLKGIRRLLKGNTLCVWIVLVECLLGRPWFSARVVKCYIKPSYIFDGKQSRKKNDL